MNEHLIPALCQGQGHLPQDQFVPSPLDTGRCYKVSPQPRASHTLAWPPCSVQLTLIVSQPGQKVPIP